MEKCMPKALTELKFCSCQYFPTSKACLFRAPSGERLFSFLQGPATITAYSPAAGRRFSLPPSAARFLKEVIKLGAGGRASCAPRRGSASRRGRSGPRQVARPAARGSRAGPTHSRGPRGRAEGGLQCQGALRHREVPYEQSAGSGAGTSEVPGSARLQAAGPGGRFAPRVPPSSPVLESGDGGPRWVCGSAPRRSWQRCPGRGRGKSAPQGPARAPSELEVECATQLRRIGDKLNFRQKLLNLIAKLFHLGT
nr:phorbol-12-myristate-13-acetate-induced protein 1 [Dasypus novemcinctus]